MNRAHLVISGDVIGVGFRAWVLRQTQDKRLTGWVKNREDDTVEIVAEGSQEQLEEFARACHKGPMLSWVKSVDVHWEKATGEFVNFQVIY